MPSQPGAPASMARTISRGAPSTRRPSFMRRRMDVLSVGLLPLARLARAGERLEVGVEPLQLAQQLGELVLEEAAAEDRLVELRHGLGLLRGRAPVIRRARAP